MPEQKQPLTRASETFDVAVGIVGGGVGLRGGRRAQFCSCVHAIPSFVAAVVYPLSEL